MTDKELRRSSRKELIEMLYYLRKELDDVREENQRLNTRLDLLLGQAQVDITDDQDSGAPGTEAEEVREPEAHESEEDGKS